MTLSRTSAAIDTALSPLTHPSRRVMGRDMEPPIKVWVPPDPCCLRCGGLLVPGCISSAERDFRGHSMALWRCVNGGDYVDCNIPANRGNALGRHQNVHDHGVTSTNPSTARCESAYDR